MRFATRQFLTHVGASLLAACVVAGGLSGCSGSADMDTTPPSVPFAGVTFGGRALVGKLPLIGASVEVYAAGTAGNGSAATALLTSALTTDSNGAFTVPAGYMCPATTSQVYVVARGGKAGAAATSANGAIALLTVVGPCSQIVASSQVVVNEVTTVAASYALAQFLSAGGNVGSSSTNTAGLGNAVAQAQALADITAGTSPGPTFSANGSSPVPRIDSVANALNACAVSNSGGSACGGLFTATTPAGSSAPTNTLDAALNLARNPALNVTSVYALSAGSAAFAPVLAVGPADWTLFVNYTGGGMNAPSAIGVDGSGNVWVASYFSVASLFSPLGKPVFAQGISGYGLSASYGLAVDANNNAWIPNQPNRVGSTYYPGNSVTVLSESGQPVAGSSGYTAGGLDFPTFIAIDTDGSAWVVDYGNSHLTHLSSSGQALSGEFGVTSGQLAFPDGIAIDGRHNVWIANQSAVGTQSATVTKVSGDGSQFTSHACCDGPAGLAIDRLGNVWVANYYGDSVSEISSAGAVLAAGTYVGGGIDHPQGIAIDGAGNVWIANYRGPSITELAGASATVPGTALSPAGGFGSDAALLEAYGIAVDASGNVWVSNFGSNSLTEFVGMASPVKTPLIALPAVP